MILLNKFMRLNACILRSYKKISEVLSYSDLNLELFFEKNYISNIVFRRNASVIYYNITLHENYNYNYNYRYQSITDGFYRYNSIKIYRLDVIGNYTNLNIKCDLSHWYLHNVALNKACKKVIRAQISSLHSCPSIYTDYKIDLK